MTNELHLYVWEDVLEDHTYGVMFALASSVDDAREAIYRKNADGPQYWMSTDPHLDPETTEDEPYFEWATRRREASMKLREERKAWTWATRDVSYDGTFERDLAKAPKIFDATAGFLCPGGG